MEIIPFRSLQEILEGGLIHLMYMDMRYRPIKNKEGRAVKICLVYFDGIKEDNIYARHE